MNIGTALKIVAEIIPILVREGIIDEVGNFHEPSAQHWAQLASEVEAVLKLYGVTVQEDVDKVIALLPMILSLAGVK